MILSISLIEIVPFQLWGCIPPGISLLPSCRYWLRRRRSPPRQLGSRRTKRRLLALRPLGRCLVPGFGPASRMLNKEKSCCSKK